MCKHELNISFSVKVKTYDAGKTYEAVTRDKKDGNEAIIAIHKGKASWKVRRGQGDSEEVECGRIEVKEKIIQQQGSIWLEEPPSQIQTPQTSPIDRAEEVDHFGHL